MDRRWRSVGLREYLSTRYTGYFDPRTLCKCFCRIPWPVTTDQWCSGARLMGRGRQRLCGGGRRGSDVGLTLVVMELSRKAGGVFFTNTLAQF